MQFERNFIWPAARPAGRIRLDASRGAALAALPLVLYVYMPRPPIPGAHLLVYPIVAGVLVILGSLLVVARPMIDRRVLVTTTLCLLIASVAGTSAFVNSPYLRATAPLDILRPFVLLIFFLYGYHLVRTHGEEEVKSGLRAAAWAIVIGQLIIATLQLLGVSAVDSIYSETKTRSFGNLLRITGSLTDPNAFGWIVSQATIVIMLLTTRRTRYLPLIAGVLLVLISGSRSVLILYPLMVAAALMLRPSGRIRLSVSALGYAAAVSIVFAATVITFGEYVPYLSELWHVVETGSLMSVHSFAVRVERWHRYYSEFQAGGHTAWLVGLGSREITSTIDNDLLYVLFRIGVLGLVLHIALLSYILILLLRKRTSALGKIGLQYLCFAMVFGIAFDTLGGWFFPLLLFYFAGLTAGLRQNEPDDAPRSDSMRCREMVHSAQSVRL